VTGVGTKQVYSRAEVRRLLKLTERQLRHWEELKLIVPGEHYGFKEFLALRAILKLRRDHRPATQIRRAVEALCAKLDGISDPLTELKLYAHGKHIHVEAGGRTMEAESGQLLLDFDRGEISRLLEFRAPGAAAAERAQERERRATADYWFQQGLQLEQSGAPAAQIIDAYRKAVELDPNAAGALVNLGEAPQPCLQLRLTRGVGREGPEGVGQARHLLGHVLGQGTEQVFLVGEV